MKRDMIGATTKEGLIAAFGKLFRSEPFFGKSRGCIFFRVGGKSMIDIEVFPTRRRDVVGGIDGLKLAIINTMELGSNDPGTKVANQTDCTGVDPRETEKLATASARSPFRDLVTIP